MFSKDESEIPQGRSTEMVIYVFKMLWEKGNGNVVLPHYVNIWVLTLLDCWEDKYVCEKCYKTIKGKGTKDSQLTKQI